MKNRLPAIIISLLVPMAAIAKDMASVLEIFDLSTGERRTVKEFPHRIEAPNWTADGFLIYNSGGRLYKIPADGSAPETPIDTGFALSCNNDHVLSPDHSQIAISHHSKEDGQSRIYTMPIGGSAHPRLVTPIGPSYLHGWSPDGKYLAYTAGRNGSYNIFAIHAEGGQEKRLTEGSALDDGPEYSPCGKHIWFNSVRSGLMQIWKMDADGSNMRQVTNDTERNLWFPHISPDGKKVVYLAYSKNDVKPSEHPPHKNVELWLMSTDGSNPKQLAKLFGGQGTINVNSWNKSGDKFAFVSYKPAPE